MSYDRNPFLRTWVVLIIILLVAARTAAQGIVWSADGNTFYQIENNQLVAYALPSVQRTVILSSAQLTPQGFSQPITIEHFSFSDDGQKILLFTNTERVWRINTRGDYWVFNHNTGTLTRLGSSRPESSLMFAKFSPDGSKVAYVSEYNIYVEDLVTNAITPLTTGGSRKLIFGTFDWAYEEEFSNRDGFRWSPDNKSIAFWQIDARETPDYYMINNTDSVYSQIVPVEYPKVGLHPSGAKIGVVNIESKAITWLEIPGDPEQHYLVRMEYVPGTNNLVVEQLNRKQNESNLLLIDPVKNSILKIYTETSETWVDVLSPMDSDDAYNVDYRHKINWLSDGNSFLWVSEKDGWRHVYRLTIDGKKETLLTPGNFDVISLKPTNGTSGTLYFLASPDNATEKYLYTMKMTGKGQATRLSPKELEGTHDYTISPNGKWAFHTFSNTETRPVGELISLPDHKPLVAGNSIATRLSQAREENNVEFFTVTTSDGVNMDGWMVKPESFDSTKKYPVVFYVYTEPWSQTVTNTYGTGRNRLYDGNMAKDGYIYMSLDGRGSPAPKGAAWRKSIYRNIGRINIRDQAMGVKEILKWNFVDPDRIAVWGWSGGGSATLNLLFQYPDIYKTGISIAAVTNLLTYDNIYQERYMGLPSETLSDYVQGSPITYAKNLQGNLLYIHGTGDDNVHYQNAEMLVNELIRHNKQFEYMIYPNRSHSINEGEGTRRHLNTLYTTYLKKYCPPGPR